MNLFNKKINLFLLVLLIVSAIDNIRNLPAAALFGSSLIFFFIFAGIVFLLPTALVSAELAATLPEHGGVYHWMTRAFGEKIGMLSIWLQWINTMVWFPTILAFIAGTAAYLFDPSLVSNKTYLILTILGLFWALTIVNLFGVNFSAKFNSFCGLIGMVIPMLLLIVLGVIWVCMGKPSQITFTSSSIFPSFTNMSNWVSLTAIMASFLGIELSGVHINDIQNPQKNFPKALGISAFFLVFTMVFGSLAIAYILPAHEINLVAGTMQMFNNFFNAFHMGWAVPIITLLILIGTVGNIVSWLISPAKGLLHAAEYGFLPKFFRKTNKYNVAHNILIAQAVLVTIFCTVFLLVPSVNAFYWFLTGLSTDLYMIMYMLLFFSAIKLRKTVTRTSSTFRIWGGKTGLWTTALLGCFGALVTIAVGFFPPESLAISTKYYVTLITVGNIVMISPVFLFYLYKSYNRKV